MILFHDVLKTRCWAEKTIDAGLKAGKPVTLAVFDLDFFYNINRKIGDREGDAALERIGQFLQNGEVPAARYDSDEFLLIFTGHSPVWIESYLAELRRQFRRSRFISCRPYEKTRITFSMGVAGSGQSGGWSGEELLKAAQRAMLLAKKRGRNQIVYAAAHPSVIRSSGTGCTTLVGYRARGNSGNGTAAAKARIAEPYGLEIMRSGELLFVDRSNHQLKVLRNGRVYLAAGIGRACFRGDGGSPLQAGLCKPSGACVDAAGRIYIADTGNQRIRMVAGGMITTHAGNGETGYTGDHGPAADASFNRPGGVACDSAGTVYTNDYGNNVIRRITPDGRVDTIAGSGAYGYAGDGGKAVAASLDRPYGLCVTPDNSVLFIADFGNHAIRMVNLHTGVISTLCGDGTPGCSGDGGDCRRARLNEPYWVSVSRNCLYIADANNHKIRMIDLGTKRITTVAGSGVQGYTDHSDPCRSSFSIPAGMVRSGDSLYIADYGNNAIRKVTL